MLLKIVRVLRKIDAIKYTHQNIVYIVTAASVTTTVTSAVTETPQPLSSLSSSTTAALTVSSVALQQFVIASVRLLWMLLTTLSMASCGRIDAAMTKHQMHHYSNRFYC